LWHGRARPQYIEEACERAMILGGSIAIALFKLALPP
jgi:hypothetical protein